MIESKARFYSWINLLAAVVFSLCLISLASSPVIAKGVDCETDNTALSSMGKAIVTFSRADGSEFEVDVKLADNNNTRSAGFQRVCASTIAAEPILFVFAYETRPSFHMNNVVAPIDIAFIDRAGAIDSVQAMQVYVLVNKNKPLYSPSRPVIAALEAHPEFFSKHNIDLDTTVSWRRVD